ncbi:MAG: hypothetical protein GY935_00250 [Gammaproteobacteria bacterium]|nr:hypothetical protein [Gammaproteobacteria bacterium]
MSKHYTRRSSVQWHKIIEEQSLSHLSQERFCKENSISYGTFQTWRKKLADKATPSHDFIEIARPAIAEQPTLALDQGLRVRLELGAGVILELSRV